MVKAPTTLKPEDSSNEIKLFINQGQEPTSRQDNGTKKCLKLQESYDNTDGL